ncbi:MAG: tRNA epoxyqueuosine(34) reductase QueG [Hyphomicrobiales bacterium]|nr:MAG: tRNA epoxyqueuosine(34) reductase QueG [Hyphomicrobiales bacterium]
MTQYIDKTLSQLRSDVLQLGFSTMAISPASLDSSHRNHLSQYLAHGFNGSMGWMEETLARRTDPQNLWPDAKSVIVLAMNYAPEQNPLPQLLRTSEGTISAYAQNRDYHDVMKGRLKTIAGQFAARLAKAPNRPDDENIDVKVFVDTAPVMEKPLAMQAGLGWQGKHTNLVSREFGSWLFLGSIFTSVALPPDTPEIDRCGSCRACLDICPTNAFPKPYQIDARRCISYLTIEHKGPIPHEFRKAIGNRIYGCDDCLAACPWNKFAQAGREAKLQARDDLKHPPLAKLAALNDASFRKFFSGSPVKRIGRDRFVRNVLIAIGNSTDKSLIDAATPHLSDPDPAVKEAAEWALAELNTSVA